MYMHARDVESYFTVNLTGKSYAQIVGMDSIYNTDFSVLSVIFRRISIRRQ